MFPTLLQLGPVYISSLGFFAFLGFLVGAFVFWKKGKEEGFDEELLLDFWILSFLAGFLVARLTFCLTNPDCWSKPFLGFFAFVKLPGFSFLGFILVGAAVWATSSLKNKWDFWQIADGAVFGLLAFQIFWRLGQFLDGSFFGVKTSLPWGLVFPGVEDKRHPIQIYEILFLLFLYWLLSKFERRYRLFSWYQDRRGEAKPGFLSLSYIAFYSFWRLLLEFVRTSFLYWGGISWEQWVSILLVVAGLVGFYLRSGREIKIDLAFLKKEKVKPLSPAKKEPKRVPRKRKKGKHIKKGLDARQQSNNPINKQIKE